LIQEMGRSGRLLGANADLHRKETVQRLGRQRICFIAELPNQKWVTDITQYVVGDQWLYLSAKIKDLCTKEIVAYQMSLLMTQSMC
jgi:transposase InsO family protein